MHAADLLSDRARLTPDRVALLDLHTGAAYTYAELNVRANRLANWLRDDLGIDKGDRVSLLAQNSIHTLDLFYGLAKIGANFAPLNWRLSANELVYIVNDLEPSLLIVGPEFTETLAEMRPRIGVSRFAGIEGAAVEYAMVYEEQIERSSEEEPPRPALDAEDTYCILYTSGTTGHAKGALLPHRQILWNCINTVISWGLTENDVSPVFTPLFHAGGLFAFMTPILYAGGRILLARGFDAEASLRAVVAHRCTVILGVPTLFQVWRQSPAYAAADFAHVHFFISGGAPCPPDLMQAWRREKGVVFRQGYGLTEVGPNCFSMTDADSVPKTGAVGRPIFHSRMKLVDPNTLAEAAPGETGELLISGPHVITGYWRNPEATAKAFIASDDPAWPWPWFRTGDMARADADGFYTIAGRFKDMIISGGENIYAAEVEAVCREHPAVADCALIGKPDAKWGEVGLLIVVLEPGQSATSDQIKAHCAARLARYKIPKEIVFADSLPYSPYGKVMKGVLRERFVG